MDSVPRASNSVLPSDQDPPGESAEDPHSSGPQPLPYIFGAVIALMTATVPLITVLMARTPTLGPQQINGTGPSVGIPAVWARESPVNQR